MPKLNHKDNTTFVKVDSADGYGNSKAVVEQHDVKGTFLQETGFLHTNNQEILNSDAILYPNENDPFIKANFNRLEGFYVIVALYGAEEDASWFKVTSVSVNRDHLLGNKIDNILCALKKTDALPGVS